MKSSDPTYNSPYGDLNNEDLSAEPRPHHSTYAYDDGVNKDIAATDANNDESSGLIKPIRGHDNESDLAMAVIDILSCCDGNTNKNQAKLLKDMESRYQEEGNLISNIEVEGCPNQPFKVKSFMRNLLPVSTKPKAHLLREFDGNTSNKNTNYKGRYAARSSSGMTVQLPVKSKKSSVAKNNLPRSVSVWKKWSLVAGAVLLVAIAVVVLLVLRFARGPTAFDESMTSSSSIITPFTSDCVEVSKQSHPHVFSQCACQGSITEISDAAERKYHMLLDAFGAEYLHSNETMASCSSRNQALVWLAQDEESALNSALIQRHALVLFFIKLNGLHWTLAAGKQEWLTPDHECTWHGIACNSNKEVTAIELWNLNLEGSIPKEIMSLTAMQTLSLPENRIKGHLPTDAFVMLPKLTDLTLFMNSISGSIDDRILDRMTTLRTFNIDSNNLTGTIPTEVGKLLALEELKVSFSKQTRRTDSTSTKFPNGSFYPAF
jgi:hypothetical protein